MSPSEWAVRPVGPADAETVDALIGAMAAEIADGTAKRSSATDLAGALEASPPLIDGVIAEQDGRACGLCVWLPWFSTWHGTPGIFVQDLYVAPMMRGKGLARALLGAVARQGRRSGATFLKLDVHRDNAAGIGLYERIGFARGDDLTLRLAGAAFQAVADGAAPDTSRR